MKVYFVRHGEPDYTQRHTKIYRGYGAEMCPLALEGMKQIKKTAQDERLKQAQYILSSPFMRAFQSGAILSRALKIDVIPVTDLHEWVPDKNYEFVDDTLADERYDEYMALGGEYPEGEDRPWESASHMRDRVLDVLRQCRYTDCIVVTAHGMLIEAVTGQKIGRGEIVEYEFES